MSPALREAIKRALPVAVRDALISARDSLAPPPLEDIVLHDYELEADLRDQPRLTLVIPSISPRKAFGGVTTEIDIFLEVGKRTGADLRILLDDFERGVDTSVVDKCARNASLDPAVIEIVPRTRDVPRVAVRASEVFYTFNWWTTLNIRPLLREQSRVFGVARAHLYAIQEYEPHFDPFSSTHMMARLAYEPRWPCWGLFNSGELYAFFKAQGHRVERAFVFEPKLSDSLRPFLDGEPPAKIRRILVYGRPSVPRNCHPAVEKGLRAWAERYPEFAEWEVVFSAGLPHPPMPFGRGRAMQSLGKLSLEAYGEMLRGAAVGLSLMASPHPSYPPLEMAHFGLRTVTNKYANKDLASSHPNILSIDDLAPETIADALAEACRAFEADPAGGWRVPSNRPSFLDPTPFDFLDDLADALSREAWSPSTNR